MWNDRRQRQYRMSRAKSESAKLENIDYLAPIIADGDMGFGGLTSTIKIAKCFVESGVAMIHVDDLASGMKRFTIGQGRTIVPTSEYIGRLTAVRMHAETMLLVRTDLIKAEFITSVVDSRDHEYIIGATLPVEPLSVAISKAQEAGETNLPKVRAEWSKTAGLMTFDEAAKTEATEEQYASYYDSVPLPTPLSKRRTVAKEFLGKDVAFDWELPRSRVGEYMFKWTIKGITERCLAVAPLDDVSWPKMDFPDEKITEEISNALRKVYPRRLFGFGHTTAYDWAGAGFSREEITAFSSKMAKQGAVFRIEPTWEWQGIGYYAEKCAKLLKEGRIAGYVEEIQKPARAAGGNSLELNGLYLADAFFETIAARDV